MGDDVFRARFALSGDSLQRPPAGYARDHPLIEDLKRKDFVAVCPLDESAALLPDLPERFAEICADGAAFTRFLCKAVEVPF